MKPLFCLLFALIPVGAGLTAAEITWQPNANMDSQLFPSLIIATATQRPADDDDNEPDPTLLGDPYGAVGISIAAPKSGAKVQVTLLENGVMNKSTWSGVLDEADTDYFIAPKINYKFEQLRKVRQQVPLNVTFAVKVNGKEIGEQTETLTLRTINDCPFGVSEAEETIHEEDQEGEAHADADAEDEKRRRPTKRVRTRPKRRRKAAAATPTSAGCLPLTLTRTARSSTRC